MLVVEVASVALARVVGAEVVVVITGGGVALVVAWLVTTEAVFEVPADSVLSVNGAELVTLPAVVATVVVVLFTVGLEVALAVGTALLARASSCELLDTGIEVIVEAVPNKLLADAPTLPVIELSKLSAVVDTGIEVTAEASQLRRVGRCDRWFREKLWCGSEPRSSGSHWIRCIEEVPGLRPCFRMAGARRESHQKVSPK